MMEQPEVSLFREYLRIKSVQPNPDYASCIDLLKRVAMELDLPYFIIEMAPGKPILIMTWKGSNPELPSILLNSHTDVVPVFPESWKYDAFAAIKEENGDIYGRGTQDMKSVGIQHIEAIRRLRKEGKTLKRTVHLSFVSDEELGGFDGMKKFVLSEEFKKLNIGLSLDEGLASPDEVMWVFYGERSALHVKFHCKGDTGHGSRFVENTAAEKARHLLNKLLDFREEQKSKLEDNELSLGDVTTVNLTMMSGGVALNVVPEKLSLGFDMRITPTTKMTAFRYQLQKWMEEAGGDIDMEVVAEFDDQTTSSVDPMDPWFEAFKTATDKHNLVIKPNIFSANTDSRFLRELGIPALGFSPMNHTPTLLHDNNEFLNEKIFLKGIDIFCDIIYEIANV